MRIPVHATLCAEILADSAEGGAQQQASRACIVESDANTIIGSTGGHVTCHFARLANPLHWSARQHLLLERLVLKYLPCKRCVCIPWRDRIHSDAVRSPLAGKVACQLIHGSCKPLGVSLANELMADAE